MRLKPNLKDLFGFFDFLACCGEEHGMFSSEPERISSVSSQITVSRIITTGVSTEVKPTSEP